MNGAKLKIIGVILLTTIMQAPVYATFDFYRTGSFKMTINDSDEQSIRFSLWSYGMLKTGDIVDGIIDTNAMHYADYQIEINKTPNQNELVNVFLNGLNNFPQIYYGNKFLMVEYKDKTDPVTAYQIYREGDIVNTSLYRFPLLENGTNIFDGMYTNYITTTDYFIIDGDNSMDANGSVQLQFGETLAETLKWDNANTRFALSDDLRVEGNQAIVGQAYIAGDHSATDSDGVLNLGRNNSAWESFNWDDANDFFNLTDDLNVSGDITLEGTTITLDADNAGAGTNVDIVAEQGSDSDGTIRYNATTNQWEISNDGGSFGAIPITNTAQIIIDGSTNNTSYENLVSFIYWGTANGGSLTALKGIMYKNPNVTSYSARIYDITNDLVIAEVTGLSNDTAAIIDFGAISNLPTGNAIFEIQMFRTGGGAKYVYMDSISLIH